MKITKAFFTCCCLLLVSISCHNGSDSTDSQEPFQPGKQYHGQGQIVGGDYTACMCCGGWWLVTMEGDTVLFGKIPDGSPFTFSDTDQFPIPVEYNFAVDSNICWERTRLVTLLSLSKI